MRILGLDALVPGADYADFSSATSVFEYDFVFWDPVNTYASYVDKYSSEHYRGFPLLSEHASVKIVSDVDRRNAEFNDFLSMGRTFVVFTSPPQKLYVDTGKREHSGTGRNRETTRLVEILDVLLALPYDVKTVTAQGAAMVSRRDDFFPWSRHKERWYYRAVLEEYPGKPLMVVAQTNKVVGSIDHRDTGAIVLNLPDILTQNDYEEEDDDSKFDDDSSREYQEPALSALIEWLTDLQGGGESTLPRWAEELHFPEERSIDEKLVKLERDIQALMTQAAQLESRRAQESSWKQLLTATGEPLERAVWHALQLFGFEQASEPIPGRRDHHIKWHDRMAVVEVKGVNKSAAESHAAQLEKWVAEAYAETSVEHKGILVVNSWRSTPIRERGKLTFPEQMLGYSKARGHCLLTSLQLLSMARAVRNGSEESGRLAELLLDTVGPLDGWDDLDALFPVDQVAEEGVVDPGRNPVPSPRLDENFKETDAEIKP